MHLARKSEPNCDLNIDSQPLSPVDTGKQGEKLGIVLHFLSNFEKSLMARLLRVEVKVIQPRIARVFTNGQRLRWRILFSVLFVFICSVRGSMGGAWDNRWAEGDLGGLGEGKSRQSQTAATRIDPKKDLPDAVKKPIGKL
jgi:hypothetical protein